MPALLTTDLLIWLLVLLGVLFGRHAARHEHLREPWRRVARSRVGMGSLVVLIAYAGIGLADSIHWRSGETSGQPYSGELVSGLDWLLAPLRERQEKTYSAPFATHLYAKETLDAGDGKVSRDYPRLAWGGRHLQDPERDFWPDLAARSAVGLLAGAVVWGLLTLGLVGFAGWRSGRSLGAQWRAMGTETTPVPWRVVIGTLGALLLLAGLVTSLAGGYHVLGTDKVGEDVLFQSLKSIRTGLMIGTLTTLVMLPAALVLGIMAGYFRGWIDDLIQYLYTTLNSIPGVLLIAAAILMLQVYLDSHADQFSSAVARADLRLLFLCLILGITSWTGLCRLLRGEALKLREQDYVQAAVAFGVSHARIIGRHILPNVWHLVLITLVLEFSGLVLAEAVLSYVNIGVDPSMNSWGNMINSARLELAREPIVWWSLAAALVFMFVLVLAANLFADVVQDAFDPRSRGSRN